MTSSTEPAEKAAMTIKAVPVATREKMVACARRRGETQAEWLTRAVDNQALIESRDLIEPTRFGAPVPIAQERPQAPVPGISMVDLRDTMAAAKAVADSSGVPVPKVAARHAYALLTQQLRGARGLPQPAPRRQPSRVISLGHLEA